ncbi:beta-propeller fold lactonase family protein [Lentzea sp. NPDC003310]|uniref:YVTN family beta-propeller repeat protein n=1 Tax=Lentzea sp. NPDC003310 TaxID=3154447 RepID=UPI0033A06650
MRLRPLVMAVAVTSALVVTPAQAAAPAGRVLGYVANNGGGVSVIDTATNAVSTTISDSGSNSPYMAAVAFDGTRGYVTNSQQNTLTVIDTPTNTVDRSIPVGTHPAGVAVAPGGGFAYVTNYLDGTVSVVDTATLTVTATVSVGSNADGVVVTRDGSAVYVTHDVPGPGKVSVIDTTANAVVATIPVGNAATAIAASADGTRMYVVNKGSDSVSAIDVASRTVVGTAAVGFTPHGIALTPNGTRAYVTNSEFDSVSVVDLTTMTELQKIVVGDRPISVALTPDGASAYVTNFNSNTVSIIDTASNTVTGSIAVGQRPVGIAINFVPPAASKLVSGTALLQLRLLGFTVRGLNATLTDKHTGVPVAGQKVVFRTVKGNPLCTATTNSSGKATCDSNVSLLVGLSTLLQGFTASYAGNNEHGGASSHGYITLL